VAVQLIKESVVKERDKKELIHAICVDYQVPKEFIGYGESKDENLVDFILTDEDTGQYCRKINETTFELKQDGAENATIDISEYTKEELEGYIKPFYGSLKELTKIYGRDSNQIIAELIFETDASCVIKDK